jgi:hypothetical protein
MHPQSHFTKRAFANELDELVEVKCGRGQFVCLFDVVPDVPNQFLSFFDLPGVIKDLAELIFRLLNLGLFLAVAA